MKAAAGGHVAVAQQLITRYVPVARVPLLWLLAVVCCWLSVLMQSHAPSAFPAIFPQLLTLFASPPPASPPFSGCDLNAVDNYGDCALKKAAFSGHADFVKAVRDTTLPSLCYCNIWSGTGCGCKPQRVRWLHEESSVSRLGRYAVKNCNV